MREREERGRERDGELEEGGVVLLGRGLGRRRATDLFLERGASPEDIDALVKEVLA